MVLRQELTLDEMIRLFQMNQLSNKGKDYLINKLKEKVYELEHKIQTMEKQNA